MRSNLKEKAKKIKINYSDEMQRIETLFAENEPIQFYAQNDYMRLYPKYTSLEVLFNSVLFLKYPFADNFVSVSDARNELGISKDDIKGNNLETMLDYFEFIFNITQFFILQYNNRQLNVSLIDTNFINKINNNIQSTLEKLNYKLEKSEVYYYIVEKDAAATAVSEIYNDISDEVIEYRRYNLKGNIKRKCEILNTLANKFEAIRPDLKANNFSEIEDKTGSLLNNLDIRHNNITGKHEKDIVKNMSDEELEMWYDRAYDLLLMCFMFHHYLDFREEVKDLNKNLKNKV